jgi:hypothetical protein
MKTGRLSLTNSIVRVRAPQAAAIGAANLPTERPTTARRIPRVREPILMYVY